MTDYEKLRLRLELTKVAQKQIELTCNNKGDTELNQALKLLSNDIITIAKDSRK